MAAHHSPSEAGRLFETVRRIAVALRSENSEATMRMQTFDVGKALGMTGFLLSFAYLLGIVLS